MIHQILFIENRHSTAKYLRHFCKIWWYILSTLTLNTWYISRNAYVIQSCHTVHSLNLQQKTTSFNTDIKTTSLCTYIKRHRISLHSFCNLIIKQGGHHTQQKMKQSNELYVCPVEVLSDFTKTTLRKML